MNRNIFNVLDLENNGAFRFTQKNISIINTCLAVDSAYRNAFDSSVEESSAYYITHVFDWNNIIKDDLAEVCRRIDKENSTHLAVSGMIKGGENNKGVEIVVEKLLKLNQEKSLKERLETIDLNLVEEIANAVKYIDANGKERTISKFSFATKFCTYMCRYGLDGKYCDNYSIYDSVIARVLPYYVKKYLGENIDARKECMTSGSNRYQRYWNLIGELISKIKAIEKVDISRDIFDRCLWYYYKGDNKLMDGINEK